MPRPALRLIDAEMTKKFPRFGNLFPRCQSDASDAGATKENGRYASLKTSGIATGQASEIRPATQMVCPSRLAAEMAVRTLIRWAGDDPDREGLTDTPARVVRAYERWFAGYREDPAGFLSRTFEEAAGYDEMVLLGNIRFVSHCEHHMAPVNGRALIGYLPRDRVVRGCSGRRRIFQAAPHPGKNSSGDSQHLGS